MELKITSSKTHSQTCVGQFDKLLADNDGDKSKQFLRQKLNLTGTEMSVNALPKDTALPFFHSHKQNEELYIVLRGAGQMQLDDELIELSEGSIVRVAPAAARNLKSGPESELVYLCIQAKEGSLEQCNKEDGVIEKRTELFTFGH